MFATPEIALSVVTYQRPTSLALVLESIAAQQGVDGKMEVVVTDDGSTDNTPQLVEAFRRQVDFPVKFTTHPHRSFQVARCRNEGAAATSAPYLLFLDGDCVLPPHHVRTHLEQREPNAVLVGDVCRLEPEASERVTEETIRSGEFSQVFSPREHRRLRLLDWKYRFYRFIRHPNKPRSLRSGDFGIWRIDFERINGFDENFCGWGGEDDDLGLRLRRAKVRSKSFLRWTYSYHLWHPIEASKPDQPSLAANAQYMRRKGRLVRCRNGLVKRDWSDMAVQIVGRPRQPKLVDRMLAGRINANSRSLDSKRQAPEVELLFLPGDGEFSGAAQCNVLVALADSPRLDEAALQAHIVVAPRSLPDAPDVLQFNLNQWDEALRAVA